MFKRFKHKTGKWIVTIKASHRWFKIYETSDYWIDVSRD